MIMMVMYDSHWGNSSIYMWKDDNSDDGYDDDLDDDDDDDV
jgi:hypothetical protein